MLLLQPIERRKGLEALRQAGVLLAEVFRFLEGTQQWFLDLVAVLPGSLSTGVYVSLPSRLRA